MATHSNGGGAVMDNYDIFRDYGPANWDVPHRFVASYLYDLPFFRDSEQPILKHVVGGWQISGITTIQSGTPVNVTIVPDRANIGITGLQRPDLVGAVPELSCVSDPARQPQRMNCYDASAFALPAEFTFGNAPRNLLRGPGSVVTDLSLLKNVSLGGQARLQLRVEMFNAFNKVNLGNPNAQVGNPAFGRITSAGNMRQIQLGAKVIF
jgi:hypothetical protein